MCLMQELLAKVRKIWPLGLLIMLSVIFYARGFQKDKIFASTDSLQTIPTFSINRYLSPNNTVLFDQTTQYLPWLKFLKDSLNKGNLPKFNPYNAGGVPFSANPQTVVYFPLTYLYLLFDYKTALLMYLISKQILICIGSYLYFNQIVRKKDLALLGSVAFSFDAYNLIWALYPISNAIIFLSPLLLLIEKVREKQITQNWYFSFTTVTMVFLMLSGHPESIFHLIVIGGIYFLYRIGKIKKLWLYITSVFLALGITLFQWLPFLSYLANSNIFHNRSTTIAKGLPLLALALNIFPNLFGNPTESVYRPPSGFSNYNEYVGGYIFPIFYLLALVYLFKMIMKSGIKLKVLSCVLLVGIVSQIYTTPLLNWSYVPLWGTIAHHRLVFVLAFFGVTLGLLLLKKGIRITKGILIYSVICLFLLSMVLVGSIRLGFMAHFNFTERLIDYLKYQSLQMGGLFLIIAITGVILYSRRLTKLKYYALTIIVLCNYYWLFGNYLPLINQRYFFPKTETVQAIDNIKPGLLADVGDLLVPANVNMWYQFNFIDNYDAIENYDYHQKVENLLPNRRDNRFVIDKNKLRALGVTHLISLLPLNHKIIFPQPKSTRYLPLNNQGFSFDITVNEDIAGLILKPVNYNRNNKCTYVLEAFSENEVISKNIYQCSDIFDRYHQVYKLETLETSGEVIRIKIYSEDYQSNNQIGLMTDMFGKLFYGIFFKGIDKEYLRGVYGEKIKIFEVY